MGGKKSERPEPSHKTRKVRDKRIEELQHPTFKPEHLHGIIKKAATTTKR